MSSIGIPNSIPTINPIQNITQNLPPFTLWLYKILAAFPLTGFTGIDHMAIGSQFTGLAKLLVNILTLGSWYVYDIVQIYNTTNLRDKGLKIPFLESGSIGKGRIDDLPSKGLKQNEKSWLYLIFTLGFGLLYFISTFFLTTSIDFIPTSIRYFSGFLLIGTIGLAIITIFSFVKNPLKYLSTPTSNTPTQALSNLYNQTGLINPATSTIPVTSTTVNPVTMIGGGLDLKTLKKAANSISGLDKPNYQHIYFGTIMLLLPISGVLVYNLRKK